MTMPPRVAILPELPLQGGELVASSSGCRQGGGAPWRAVPARRLHRHELAAERAATTTEELRPFDDATKVFAANRGDAGLTPRQTNVATWRARKATAIIRRRLEKGGHMGNPS